MWAEQGKKGKGKKVKLSLCLTKQYTMKTYGVLGVQVNVFLTSALVGEWSVSRTCRFTP
jgi:hypothetical protein